MKERIEILIYMYLLYLQTVSYLVPRYSKFVDLLGPFDSWFNDGTVFVTEVNGRFLYSSLLSFTSKITTIQILLAVKFIFTRVVLECKQLDRTFFQGDGVTLKNELLSEMLGTSLSIPCEQLNPLFRMEVRNLSISLPATLTSVLIAMCA